MATRKERLGKRQVRDFGKLRKGPPADLRIKFGEFDLFLRNARHPYPRDSITWIQEGFYAGFDAALRIINKRGGQ